MSDNYEEYNNTETVIGITNNQKSTEHKKTLSNTNSARKVQGSKGTFSKTDPRYWMQGRRLFKWEGSNNFSFQRQHKGKRPSFSTHCSEKAAAAKIAAKINQDIIHLGIDAVIARERPQKVKSEVIATVGDWIVAAKGVSDVTPRSFGINASSLRLIVGEICGVKKDNSRFGPLAGGASGYRSKVDAISLDVLTLTNVQKWKLSYVKRIKKGGSQSSRMTSCNSTISQAKSLFAQKIVEHLPHLKLPTPIPFDRVQRFPMQSAQYNSIIEDHKPLISEAQLEMGQSDHPTFLAIILAIGAGLRRHEADRLLWKNVHPDKGYILAEGSKSADSTGMVPIDKEISTLLSKYKKIATGRFVLASPSEDFGPRSWGYKYRANASLDKAVSWLRGKGIDVQKPVHELRKEYGSLANQQHSLFAASKVLRHSNPQITAAHYIDLKTRPIVQVGGSLDLTIKVEAPVVEAAKAGKPKKG